MNIHNQIDIPNFSITQETLSQIVEANDFNFLDQLGGIQYVASSLETNLENGINGDQIDLHRRKTSFGSNQFSEKEFFFVNTKAVYQQLLEAFTDTTIILLLCSAILSLAISIKINGPQEGIIDGVFTILAICFVVCFGVVSKFIKNKWMMRKLSKQKRVAFVFVVRQGTKQKISVSEIVVGDVLCLENGNNVPVDGLFIHGDSNFKLDCVEMEGSNNLKCFSIFKGSKVANGNCKMLVTSVGVHTERSKLMKLLKSERSDHYDSELQNGIDKLSSNLEKVGLILSLLVLVVQLLRCFFVKSMSEKDHNPDPKGVKNFFEEIMVECGKLFRKQSGKVNGIVAILCMLIFALRECLPLGIFVTFLYASKKVKSCKAIIRRLPACATLGLITTICLGKTDDLVLDCAKMAELWIGLKRVENISGEVNLQVIKSLQEAIYCTNFSSNQEDDALVYWAQKVLGMDVDELQKSCVILQNEALDLHRNYCIMCEEKGNLALVHWKGDPLKILSMCSHYCDVDGSMQTLGQEKRKVFNKIVEDVRTSKLQCFAFAYKQILQDVEGDDNSDELTHVTLPGKSRTTMSKQVLEPEKTLESFKRGLTLLGLVVVKNPYELETRQAVEACLQSGVKIKLVVDDDLKTAKIMAINTGILRPGNDINRVIIEASAFRNSSEEDRMRMIDTIQVLANASPIDKLLMVQCLRQKAEVVAATGASSRDFPSLREADIGLFTGPHCPNCSKDDVDILVSGLNLGMITTLVKFGRCVCHNLEKFIELQLTVNVAAFTIDFIVVISSSQTQFTPFQLLWVNLIMEVLGALALSTQLVTSPGFSSGRFQDVTQTGPFNQVEQYSSNVYGEDNQIITKNMSKNIAFQSIFQVTISLIIRFKGKSILQVNDQSVLRPLIFIFYVFSQVFKLLGTMKINKTEGVLAFKNKLFVLLVSIIIILQVVYIEIMGIISQWKKLNAKLWCICTAIASLSLFVNYACKLIE